MASLAAKMRNPVPVEAEEDLSLDKESLELLVRFDYNLVRAVRYLHATEE